MRNSIEFEARVRQLAAEKKEIRRKRITFFTTLGTTLCACVVALVILLNNHPVNNVKSNNAVYEDYDNSGLNENDVSNMKENMNNISGIEEEAAENETETDTEGSEPTD